MFDLKGAIIKKVSSFEQFNDLDIIIPKKLLKKFLKLGSVVYQYENKEYMLYAKLDAYPFIKLVHIQVGGLYKNGRLLATFKELEQQSTYSKKYKCFIINSPYYRKINKPQTPTLKKRLQYCLNLTRRRSLSIALLGVDGAGKSTLEKELYNILQPSFRMHSRYMGWKQFTWFMKTIYFFSPGKQKTNKRLQSSTNKQHKKTQTSTFQLILLMIELWFRYLALTPQRILGKTIIYDRYFYDITLLHDRWKLLQWITPKPTLTLVIDAPVSILLKRKNEFSKEALIAKRKEIHLIAKRSQATIIENKDLDKTLKKLIEELYPYLCKKHEILVLN